MQVYYKVADCLSKISSGHANFKYAVFEHQKNPKFTQIYALTSAILQHRGVLDRIEKFVRNSMVDESIDNRFLFRVILYEHVISSKKLKMGGKLSRMVKTCKPDIIKHFGAEITPLQRAAEKKLIKKLVHVRYIPEGDAGKEQTVHELRAFKKEAVIPNLYCLEYGEYTKFNEARFPLYKHPNYVIQSKSSCLPVHILHRELGSGFEGSIIETCSAPGNKTLQILEYFPKAYVHSFELDPKRFKVLQQRVAMHSKPYFADRSLYNADFFNAANTGIDLTAIKAVVCDPSCSGSGMLNRIQDDAPEGTDLETYVDAKVKRLSIKEADKVKQLAVFQRSMISFCMRSLPNLTHLVYSTCSVYPQEDEEVVEFILKEHPQFELANALDGLWSQRGFSKEKWAFNAEYCIRENPLEKENDGFFVALFKRK